MLVYAEPNDLLTGNWVLEVPDNTPRLIERASVLVRRATRVAVYNTQPSGLPEDDDLREALQKATLAQVTMWTKAGIDPDAGIAGQPVAVQSQSADGGSVTYTNIPSAEEIRRAVNTLCPAAMDYLEDAGLVSTRPRTW